MNIFRKKDPIILQAKIINKIGQGLPSLIPLSSRSDLKREHFKGFVADLLGIHYSTLAHHDAVLILTVSGHPLESLMIVRAHLEAVLIMMFFVEPEINCEAILARVERYRDWVNIQMYKNMQRSSKLELFKEIYDSSHFISSITENYQQVLKKYSHRQKELESLIKSNSFLINKRYIAEQNGIEDLYDHIHAEASASIHVADISDRMQEHHTASADGYIYAVRHKHISPWPLALSNLMQLHELKKIGSFLGIAGHLQHKLEKVMKT